MQKVANPQISDGWDVLWVNGDTDGTVAFPAQSIHIPGLSKYNRICIGARYAAAKDTNGANITEGFVNLDHATSLRLSFATYVTGAISSVWRNVTVNRETETVEFQVAHSASWKESSYQEQTQYVKPVYIMGCNI